jgi:hypothetical protein
MKYIAKLAFNSVYGNIDPEKKDNSFEVKNNKTKIFGLDYMIDENFQVYLIEVNTNPCLELSSTLLCRLIPNMIENVMRLNKFLLRIAIDPIFPPPDASKWTGGKSYKVPENILEANRFELIFDELVDGKNIKINTENKF